MKADPEDLLTREVPHLAFFDAAYYDRIIAKVDKRNAMYRRARNGEPDPCANRPKKRTRFPGQTIYCGVCGRKFVFGGNGQASYLMCNGAREYKCWVGATVNGVLAAERISEVVLAEIEKLAGYDSTFLTMVNEEAERLDAARVDRLRGIDRELTKTQKEAENLMKFIRSGDTSDFVRGELHRLEEKVKELSYEKSEIERTPSNMVQVPPIEEIKKIARESFSELALDSFEFADYMRKLTGPIYVYPFRLCDGGDVVLRAKFQLQIANLLSDVRLQEVLRLPMQCELKVDLFDPPQREAFRKQVIALREEMTEQKAAEQLGITITAAQRASALTRLMEELGLDDPYVLTMEPPLDCRRLRRHEHPRYHFEPLPEHTPDW